MNTTEALQIPTTDTSPRNKSGLLKPTPALKRAVRNAYICGQGYSLRALASKFQLSEWTVKAWAEDEDWGALRSAFDKARFAELAAKTVADAPIAPPEPAPATTRTGKIEIIEKQLEAIDKAIEEGDAKSLPSLLKAKSMAMDIWADLTGFPKRGTRKAGKTRSGQPDIQPIGVSEDTTNASLSTTPESPAGQ